LATSSKLLAAVGDGVSDTMLNIFGLMMAGQIKRRNMKPLRTQMRGACSFVEVLKGCVARERTMATKL